MKYIIISLVIMVLLTYVLGWIDLVQNKMLTGNWIKDILKSFSYYISWVIPYWWLIIIIGTIVLALLIFGVKAGINRLR